jgi:putative aldouronate transport system substrate-binding protein
LQGWRKTLALMLIVVLTVGIVSACSKSDGANNGGGSASQNQSTPSSTPGNSGDGSQQQTAQQDDRSERYTITMLDFRYGTLPPPDGQGIQMINEKFNVDYRPTYVSVNDYMQKVSVTLAGGDMPDILILENPMDPLYYKWAAQGAFLPVTEFYDQYESLKLIPDFVKEGLRVNGEIYGIPGYTTSTYSITPMIRVDWLENLGLSMPTNYDELKQVALAFTRDDPDRNGKHDTYGMAMAENINPQYHLGAYWDFQAWYHQDEEGNYIPGIISEVRKNHIQWLKELYQAGAITQDFALINWGQAYREFFGGKAGMFITTPKGIGNDNVLALLEIDPDAKLAPIPPFVDPDGNQGFAASEGTYRLIMLNAKLKDEPGKVRRIMEMIDYGRKFIPPSQAGPHNEDYDWLHGREGSGYKMVDGLPVVEPGDKGLKPRDYLPDLAGWAPNDAANEYPDQFKSVPLHYELTKLSAEMHDSTKHYYGPNLGLYTPAKQENELNLYFLMYQEQTKMITGQTPIEEWDAMVELYMREGGAQMIKEVNEKIREVGAKPEWR